MNNEKTKLKGLHSLEQQQKHEIKDIFYKICARIQPWKIKTLLRKI